MNRENRGTAGIGECLIANNRQYKRYEYPQTEKGYCYFAITVKCNLLRKSYITKDEIQAMINEKFSKFTIHTQVWELDSRQVLHSHMLASYKSTCCYRNFRQYGWNIHCEPLTTPAAKERWERYLEKEQESDILLRYESLYQNLFD